MPQRTGEDPDTKEIVKFPVFAYTDREKNKRLLQAIIAKGKEYIEDALEANTIGGQRL